MTGRAISWSLSLTSAVLVVAGVTATFATARLDTNHTASVLGILPIVIPVLAFSVVGGLISASRPGHPIGWLLAVIGALFSLVVGSSSIVHWGLLTGKMSPGFAEWLSIGSNAWVVALGLVGTQLLIRLPDGSLPSPGWRWYSRATALLIVFSTVGMATEPGTVEGVEGTANPLGSETAAQLSAAFFLVILSFVVGIAALVLRYRRSTGHDRAQLRWVAFSGAVFVTMYIVGLSLLSIVDEDSAFGSALTAVIAAGFAALPVGIGFAVLRQRLYDIDVVINRALVYGTLTAMLAGIYLGSVLLLQLSLQGITEGSGLAVAASTLATAALVRPARARIQDIVDRRFYRRKYDAARMVRTFSARMRDQIDLETVQDDLRSMIAETVQPAHVSLWLKNPELVTISGRTNRRQESS